MARATKLHLEDHGQDLLWLVVDENRTIIEAGLFQNWVWAGRRLTTGDFKPGDDVVFEDGLVLKYAVTEVEPIDLAGPDAEASIEQGRRAARLGAMQGDCPYQGDDYGLLTLAWCHGFWSAFVEPVLD